MRKSGISWMKLLCKMYEAIAREWMQYCRYSEMEMVMPYRHPIDFCFCELIVIRSSMLTNKFKNLNGSVVIDCAIQ